MVRAFGTDTPFGAALVRSMLAITPALPAGGSDSEALSNEFVPFDEMPPSATVVGLVALNAAVVACAVGAMVGAGVGVEGLFCEVDGNVPPPPPPPPPHATSNAQESVAARPASRVRIRRFTHTSLSRVKVATAAARKPSHAYLIVPGAAGLMGICAQT